MKVGDAGEAFFVFETDEDVPQDLITSPILQATQPGQKNQDIEAGRFGTKEGSDEEEECVPEPVGRSGRERDEGSAGGGRGRGGAESAAGGGPRV